MKEKDSFDDMIKKILNKDSKELEESWIKYFSSFKPIKEPSIIETIPVNGTVDVSTKLSSIVFKFNVPMKKNIILISEGCNSGICFENASWESSTILKVVISKSLLNNKKYKISLGNKDFHMMSEDSLKLQPFEYSFTTVRM